jgi:hypothetical protein
MSQNRSSSISMQQPARGARARIFFIFILAVLKTLEHPGRPVLVPQHQKYTIQISTKSLSEILLVQVGSQSIHLVFEPSETAEERLYLNVYNCVWRKRWFCSSGHTRPHHRSIVWPV